MRPAGVAAGRSTVRALAAAAVVAVALAAAALLAVAVRGGPPGAAEATRRAMVDQQIRARGVSDPEVLAAMEAVPRHRFVPASRQARAYADTPLPIGYGQTISQPYVVARMCELLAVGPGDRVLEIGTGSGYHAAVLSRIAGEVYSIEIVRPLARRATALLAELGYDNVHVRAGDGYAGWPAEAPFAGILLTAAPPEIPQPLLDQLAIGGRLVAPVGVDDQELTVVTRTPAGLEVERVAPVRFVPMTGEAQQRD